MVIYYMMTLKLITFTLYCSLVISSFAGETADRSGAAAITPDEIMSHIGYLASDELEGRGSGTEGGRKAAIYIARGFMEAGLSPLGDGGTYFQYFPIPPATVLGESSSFVLKLGKRASVLSPGDDYYPLVVTEDGHIKGGIVFAGYGISAPELGYDDYADIDAEGSIVLALRYAPKGFGRGARFYKYSSLRHKIATAREKGAVAVVFVTPLSRVEETDLRTAAYGRPVFHTGMKAYIIRREAAREILSYSGNDMSALEEALSRGIRSSFKIPEGYAEIRTDFSLESCKGANVLGFLQGRDPELRDEVIIIGAHYDHLGRGGGNPGCGTDPDKGVIYNGADDNASGVAGLLELAEFFSAGGNITKRSLLFMALSGEEIGLLGSGFYVSHPKMPHGKTVAMINLDMIGRLSGGELTVLGAQSWPHWKDLVDSANRKTGLKISYAESLYAPGDQSSFQMHGIPAIQFSTGLHDEYHTPDDDLQRINPQGEVSVLEVVSNLITRLGNAEAGMPNPQTGRRAVRPPGLKSNPWILLDY